MAQGTGVMNEHTYTNLRKFNDRMNADGTPATPASGKLGSFLPVGNWFGDDLIRRSVLYLNINAEVSAQSEYPEAAYLFLQWASCSRIFSWMSGNPAGYFDPFQKANFDDPLVQQTYHKDHVEVIQETIKRSAPTINFAGQSAFDNGLDEELQRALIGDITPEEAMKNASKKMAQDHQEEGRGQDDRGHPREQQGSLADHRRQGLGQDGRRAGAHRPSPLSPNQRAALPLRRIAAQIRSARRGSSSISTPKG